MIAQIDFHIDALDAMKHYPKELYYIGNTELLASKKVAIVGSRKPNTYAREMNNLGRGKVVAYIKSNYGISYNVIFELYSYSDFLSIEVKRA